MQHTSLTNERDEDRCDCQALTPIPFLDTACSIGKYSLRQKDRNLYLLTNRCHPVGCTNNIPYSLGLWIVRICTNTTTRDTRLEELKTLLLGRNYPERLVVSNLDKAR